VAVMLASEESAYITGTEFTIDGRLPIHRMRFGGRELEIAPLGR
jgi:hypothetical protein